MRRFAVWAALLGAAFLFLGCENGCQRAGTTAVAEILVASYNVHNLFDAADDGSEYPEFRSEGGRWDETRYRSRLADLARVLLAMEPARKGPDLACLEEVENLAVLEALRTGPLSAAGYRCSALVPAPGQAVNCGILSRWPVTRVLAHGLAVGAALPNTGRYLLEVGIDLGGTGLTVFVCHWKSKLGGAELTEAERREDAAVLAARLSELLAADPAALILACGDFNESPDEYERVGRRYETGLMPAVGELGPASGSPRLLVATARDRAGLSCEGCPVMWTAWAEQSGGPGWSYLNNGAGERIDGFLLSPALALGGSGWGFSAFEVFAPSFILNASGAPLAYSQVTGKGFSDHLPILLRLSRQPGPDRGRRKKARRGGSRGHRGRP